mmetsp:Transcript_18775/g.54255  ORF Transcript_18775/g.54255 Transcript_18775/m.54255 type:complete len:276 (+) Transcript_18775:993-1820(+)
MQQSTGAQVPNRHPAVRPARRAAADHVISARMKRNAAGVRTRPIMPNHLVAPQVVQADGSVGARRRQRRPGGVEGQVPDGACGSGGTRETRRGATEAAVVIDNADAPLDVPYLHHTVVAAASGDGGGIGGEFARPHPVGVPLQGTPEALVREGPHLDGLVVRTGEEQRFAPGADFPRGGGPDADAVGVGGVVAAAKVDASHGTAVAPQDDAVAGRVGQPEPDGPVRRARCQEVTGGGIRDAVHGPGVSDEAVHIYLHRAVMMKGAGEDCDAVRIR